MTNRTFFGTALVIGCVLISPWQANADEDISLDPARGVIVTSDVVDNDDANSTDRLQRGDVITNVGDVECADFEELSRLLGERQNKNYLPRGIIGRMRISYLASVSERSRRLLSSIISFFGTMTPIG